MKYVIPIFLIVFCKFSYAKNETKTAADICLKSATTWAIKTEAKKTGAKVDQIKTSEAKSLGSGANLYLASVFVDGPKTGENTHWEIVGEFNFNKHTCEILVGKSYWAH